MFLKNYLFALLLLSPFIFSSCMKDKCEREYTYTKAIQVNVHMDDIRTDVTLEPVRDLKNPGKIYYYNDMLFINEQKQGVHIYDNSDPQNPVKLGFYRILGNVDIAIQNNILYADSYIDLVTVDISDIQNPQTLSRTEDVFQGYYWIDQQSNQLVDYEYEEVTEMMDCDGNINGGWGLREDAFSPNSLTNVGGDFNSNSGTGGSLARFTINSGHLYSIDHSNLHVFDIRQAADPIRVNEVGVSWQIETIFPYQDKLFIGSTTGLFVMDASDPANPFYLSGYSHALACDPVFVKGDYAYVTLRSGNNWCTDSGDQLDLVDISDITDIKLEKSFPMDNPHGLSIRDNNLFLCEGDQGMKVFDISTPSELDDHRIAHLKNIKSKDVITLPGTQNLMLIIGDDGFYQYDINDAGNPQFLSTIRVVK